MNNHELMHTIDLPSKFKPYDFKELRARPLTVAEVKVMRSAILGESKQSLAEVLSTAFSEDLSKLTHGDFWVAAAWLRINSFVNTPLTVSWNCSECTFRNETEVKLNELDMVELPDYFKEPAKLTLPVCGDEVSVKLYRVGNESISRNYLKNMSADGTYTEADLWIADLATTLADMKLHDAFEYIKNLKDPGDALFLNQFQSEFSHGLPNKIKGTCKGKLGGQACGNVVDDIRFEFRTYDLLPNRVSKEHFRNAVRFEQDGGDVAD